MRPPSTRTCLDANKFVLLPVFFAYFSFYFFVPFFRSPRKYSSSCCIPKFPSFDIIEVFHPLPQQFNRLINCKVKTCLAHVCLNHTRMNHSNAMLRNCSRKRHRSHVQGSLVFSFSTIFSGKINHFFSPWTFDIQSLQMATSTECCPFWTRRR